MNYKQALDKYYGKPYYSLDAYCKDNFHRKCYKIALDAHMTCPNRDGTCGLQGCIFCSAGGSGEFAVGLDAGKDINWQIEKGIELFKDKNVGNSFIAYFQAYTNTYGPIDYLEQVYRIALESDRTCGISIATRPDCLPNQVLELLSKLKAEYPNKFIWIELGLQTIHEDTALLINRGYELNVFEKAMENLKAIGIPVIVHLILGLPGENEKRILESIRYLNTMKPFGIKLQLLHVLKNTVLAQMYEDNTFSALELDEYIPLLANCICNLDKEIVVHRITGDGPKELLIAPLWSLNKRNVLNTFHSYMKENNYYQGLF